MTLPKIQQSPKEKLILRPKGESLHEKDSKFAAFFTSKRSDSI